MRKGTEHSHTHQAAFAISQSWIKTLFFSVQRLEQKKINKEYMCKHKAEAYSPLTEHMFLFRQQIQARMLWEKVSYLFKVLLMSWKRERGSFTEQFSWFLISKEVSGKSNQCLQTHVFLHSQQTRGTTVYSSQEGRKTTLWWKNAIKTMK